MLSESILYFFNIFDTCFTSFFPPMYATCKGNDIKAYTFPLWSRAFSLFTHKQSSVLDNLHCVPRVHWTLPYNKTYQRQSRLSHKRRGCVLPRVTERILVTFHCLTQIADCHSALNRGRRGLTCIATPPPRTHFGVREKLSPSPVTGQTCTQRKEQ